MKLKDGSEYEVKMSDFRIGEQMLAFYIPRTKKVADKKADYNEIFQFELFRSPRTN